ncbi:MAG: hypothetical protein ACKPKO_09405, partial [Candidatus Fonsibacter sp.]
FSNVVVNAPSKLPNVVLRAHGLFDRVVIGFIRFADCSTMSATVYYVLASYCAASANMYYDIAMIRSLLCGLMNVR